MSATLDGGWTATVTDDPLRISPRLDVRDFRVRVAPYAGVEERGRFLLETFGSQPWRWDTPDELRCDLAARDLVGAEFQIAGEAAEAEGSARVPAAHAVRPGGLRADEAADFRLEVTTRLCRAPDDSALARPRGLDVLDEPLQARIRIAPDRALLVSHGTVVGQTLTDPARYLGTCFAAPPRLLPRRPGRGLRTPLTDSPDESQDTFTGPSPTPRVTC
jgi:hypothetical protein